MPVEMCGARLETGRRMEGRTQRGEMEGADHQRGANGGGEPVFSGAQMKGGRTQLGGDEGGGPRGAQMEGADLSGAQIDQFHEGNESHI